MGRLLSLGLLALVATTPAGAQETGGASPLEARVWLDRGNEPVLQRGDRVKVYYRTSADANTAIFRVDTDGRVTLIHPAHPGADRLTRGGRDYQLLFPESAKWVVSEYPGVGYFFIVAADRPLDFARFEFDASEDRWNLDRVGETVYEDPYVAIDDYVAALIPDWEVAPYTLDFIEYSVGEAHSYPRFLCYDCHGYQPYARWNPYTYACTDFRVVVWDDPYYYPAYRYSGVRVVFPRPLPDRPRYTVAARAPGEGWSPLVRVRPAPPVPRRVTQYKEPDLAPTSSRGAVPRRSGVASDRSTAVRNSARASAGSRARPNGTARRAPSRALPSAPRSGVQRPAKPVPGRAATGRSATNRAAPTSPTTGRAAAPRSTTPSRPTLQRRPSSATRRGAGATSRPSTGRTPHRSSSPTRSVAPSRTRTQAVAPRRLPVTRSAPGGRSAPSSRLRPSASPSRPTTTTRARPTTTGARPTPARPTTRSAPARRPPAQARPKPPPKRRGGGK